jgi:hypothetical protein
MNAQVYRQIDDHQTNTGKKNGAAAPFGVAIQPDLPVAYLAGVYVHELVARIEADAAKT